MTSRVAQIWRHPIKSHGRESLNNVRLFAGKTMPWDRTWAVAHEYADVDGSCWAPCVNFSRGSKAASLQAINVRLDEKTELVTLTHPDLPELTFRPDTDTVAFLSWVNPIMPENRAASKKIIRVPNRGMTDTDFPSISLINIATNRVVGESMGTELSLQRWRGNLYIDGLAPWEEFDWIGKTVRVGTTALKVRERIARCLATAANPETGIRDTDTLGALEQGWGHRDFGVYAEVISTGEISVGDTIEMQL